MKYKLYTPDPVYAEQSTYNFSLALSSLLQHLYPNDKKLFDESLINFKNLSRKSLDESELSLISSFLFQAICFRESIENKYLKKYFYFFDIAGVISDFYYAMYVLANSMIIFSGQYLTGKHALNIKAFQNLVKDLPAPFSYCYKIDLSSTSESKLISKQNFKFIGDKSFSPKVMSSALISQAYGNRLLNLHQSKSVISEYLRGTVEFQIERKVEEAKFKRKLNPRVKKDKMEINKNLHKIEVNIMSALYRYRTKAHYRDFKYLALDFTNHEGKHNNTMNVNFYKHVSITIKSMIILALAYGTARAGKEAIDVILKSFKFKDEVLFNISELFD